MVHILFEDSTSGIDVVSTIIRRCFNVKKQYLCTTFGGVHNLNKALNNIVQFAQYRYNNKVVTVHRGDIVVIYADKVTLNFETLHTLAPTLNTLGVPLYISNFYCFESVFYSYDRFAKDICGVAEYHKAYCIFKKMLLTEQVSHYRLVRDRVAYNLQNLTAESFATWLFDKYYNKMPCVRLVKGKNYVSLDNLLQKSLSQINPPVQNCYYNNLCGKGSYGKFYCNKHNKTLNHCVGKYNSCNMQTIGKHGNKSNLQHFYKNTLLSINLLKFVCDDCGTIKMVNGVTIEQILS